MGHIIFLTNLERQYVMMERARDNLLEEGKLPSAGRTVFLGDIPWTEAWEEEFAASDFVFFSWMGSGLDTEFLKRAAEFLKRRQVNHIMLITEIGLDDLCYGVTPEDRQILQKYLNYGGLENYRNFWFWLSSRFGGEQCEYQPPRPLLWNGIFHPGAAGPFNDSAEYRRRYCRPERPTVGIVFYRDEWLWGDLAYQTALVETVERQGMNAMAVFTQGTADPELQAPGLNEAMEKYFYDQGRPLIDVLINMIKFSLTATRSTDLQSLKRLGVPILQAYTLFSSREEWNNSIEGMLPMEIAFSVAMPEIDGSIHSVPVAGHESLPDGQSAYLPLAERVEMVTRKAGKWARLRHKANADKKIGIIFHNYPATNANIGSAAGLDSPESIRRLLAAMAERGYRVDHIPADSQSFIEDLVAHATNDRRYITDTQIAQGEKISGEQYREYFDAMEEPTQTQLERDWGEPPGDVFNYDGRLLVPGTPNGNIFITVQPPRGFGEDPAKLYHSPDCAPTHHYLAYYQWLRDVWGADAVVHVGTHGTLEWLPGKGAALSHRCYPDLALGDLPNVYPYWITVIGEGIQAKRRGAACLIGHLSPPMSTAGTYDELAELEELLDEYVHFRQNQPERLEVMAEQIRAKVRDTDLQDDLPEEPGESFDDYLLRLHAYISDLKQMQIRVGLHILGQPPQDDGMIEYLLALTNVDNDQVPSLRQAVAAIYGFDYYQLLEESGKLLPDGRSYGMVIDEIRSRSREAITLLAEHGYDPESSVLICRLPWAAAADGQIKQRLVQVGKYICQTLVPHLEQTTQEITNTLEALEGRYVEPGPAGAPSSGMADVLPTGRNFYGIDPRLLPTPAAWEIGKKMGDELIADYLEQEGRYPENAGIVVWATGNERSHGQCIAEFLYLLGVRPVWQRGSRRVTGLEVISADELQRPRIDVTARISGLFRDSMPMGINWMDKAVELVVNLDEGPEINYVRKHVLQDVEQMQQDGVESGEAWVQASYRIFGDPPGTYGAGIADLLEAKNWETIDDLAKVYVRWGGHAYGNKAKGAYLPELFSRRMGSLDVTIQNEDNREISMLNSDDYNAYHGGMIASVRSLKGEAPRSYTGDSSDRKRVVMRSLLEEIKRLFRGEAINPKFIEGMKQHGYKGAADLASYVAHSYQWDATSDVLDDWMYRKYAEKYALDQEMQQWMREVNPWALQRIVETLLEAESRGLWQADEEIKGELQQLYLSIEGDLEERSDE